MFVKFFVSVLKMKGASEETKMVLAAVDAGLKKLHTLDDSITLYEVINVSLIRYALKKQARKSSEDTHFTENARFEKVWAG